MAGDVFIALTTEADLVFFQDESEQYRELARFQVADSPVWAHPVILGPRALIKDASRLSMWAWEAL
jgi:hypothetical protein